MRIKELELVSFGKWHRKTIALKKGLSYFFGPNEAGKSSIRMFIIYILFGLKSDERTQYTSKLDGQLGGRMSVEIDSRLYILERFSHRNKGHLIVKHQGSELEKTEVKKLLKGLNRTLFESIFSFEDRDLQVIRQYDKEDVGAILFNLGLTGSHQITQIENQLVKESEELFKKQGKKPPINEKLLELKQLDDDIRQAQQREASHQELYHELEAADQKVNSLKSEEKQLLENISELKKLMRVKSSIIKHQILTDEIQNLSDVEEFPEDAEEQVKQLTDHIHLYENQIRHMDGNIKKAEQDLVNIENQILLNEWPLTPPETQLSIQNVTNLTKEIERLEQQLNLLNHDFKNVQNELGIQADQSSYEGLAINHYTNEKWKRLSNQWDQYKTHIQSLKLKIDHQTEELHDHQEQEQRIRQNMMDPSDRQQLQEQFDSLRLEEQNQKVKEQYQNQIASQQSTIKKVDHLVAVTKWLTPLLIIVLTLILMNREGLELLTVYGGLTVGLIISLVVFFALNQTHKSIKQTIKRLRVNEHQSTDHSQELSRLHQQLSHEEELEQKLTQIEIYIKGILSRLDELDKELANTSTVKREIEDEIEQQVNKFPFLKKFDLYHWPSVYEHLSKGRNLALTITETKQQLQKTTDQIEVELEPLKTIASLYEPQKVFEDTTLVANVVQDYLEREKNKHQSVDQKKQWLNEQLNEKSRLTEELKGYQLALNNLLEENNAHNLEEFQEKLKRFKVFKEKTMQRSNLYELVYEVYHEEAERVVKEKVDWSQLEVDINKSELKLNDIKNQIEHYRNFIADQQAQIKHLEENGVLSELVHKRSIIEADIIKLSKQWAILKTAYGLLKDTKNRYQNVYLPGIMEKTSGYFEKITGGQYVKVQFNDEESILVNHVDGQWFNVQQLSEGTADQLYISLRFALNDSLRSYVDFPFILDDAFVHSDVSRKKEILSIVSDIAKRQQVLYLTCDQSEEELLNHERIPLSVNVS